MMLQMREAIRVAAFQKDGPENEQRPFRLPPRQVQAAVDHIVGYRNYRHENKENHDGCQPPPAK
jgi:hypothetical protein